MQLKRVAYFISKHLYTSQKKVSEPLFISIAYQSKELFVRFLYALLPSVGVL